MQNKYRRFFSHFTFIYPDLFLKNVIVELNDQGRISAIFPFEKEIENTEFYSGKLFYLPVGITALNHTQIPAENYRSIDAKIELEDLESRVVYNEQGLIL